MVAADTAVRQRSTTVVSSSASPPDPENNISITLKEPDGNLDLDPNDSNRKSDCSHSSRPVSEQTSLLHDIRFGRIDLLSAWFPEVDPSHDRAKGWRTRHSKRRNMLLIAVTTSHFILVSNFVCLVVFSSVFGKKSTRGVIPLYEGDCDKVKRFGILSHVCINILSTLLLGASNLCMQLLAAPTRDEVDKAHRKRYWLDIGVPSWRNLRYIGKARKVLWFALGLSSIPLHFIYNSALSTSIAQLGYPTVVASESFLHGADIGNWTEITTVGSNGFNPWPPMDIWNNWQAFQYMQANASNPTLFQKLSNKECIKKYANVFSERTSLVVILEDLPSDPKNASVHQYIYWPAQYGGWSRYNPCTSEFGAAPFALSEYTDLGMNRSDNPLNCQDLNLNTDEEYERWMRFNRTVLYCLSEYVHSEHCRINYSPPVFIAVCCFSAVKCVCILVTLVSYQQPALCTIGDAIASFLEIPDQTTAHMGPVTKFMFKSPKSRVWTEDSTLLWLPQPQRWFSGPSRRRWIFTLSLCAIAIVVALADTISGVHGTWVRNNEETFAWDMRQGLNQMDPNSWTAYFMPRWGANGLIANVIWANMWQVIISFLYLAYNSLLTCMLVSQEWSHYATERKTLRVTHPRGIQRSTYFLSLPYKYAVPLMAANTTLHWLISQSMFIVSITTFYPNYVETVDTSNKNGPIMLSYTVTGYNTELTVISIIVGFCLVVIIIIVSWFRTISSGIPLVSTCSAAISAACHCPEEDTDASLLPVQWGVITPSNEKPIRCSFTTLRNVRSPAFGEEIRGKNEVMEVAE